MLTYKFVVICSTPLFSRCRAVVKAGNFRKFKVRTIAPLADSARGRGITSVGGGVPWDTRHCAVPNYHSLLRHEEGIQGHLMLNHEKSSLQCRSHKLIKAHSEANFLIEGSHQKKEGTRTVKNNNFMLFYDFTNIYVPFL